ncbi:MAG TPA: right-handed parallel beta-helix repeat-containing protein [Chitinispirillaceae bacterium]|nr:right-handed parallel beta-helix repeat-containing protein [Chitinispirillaceae bacterium]
MRHLTQLRFTGSLLLIFVIVSFAGQSVDSLNSISNAAEKNEYLQEVTTGIELPEGIVFGKFTKKDGALFIKGNAVVPSGQSLELGPGCVVYIGGEYTTITVFGQIIASGTREEPVVFMSARKSPKPWDWDRIYCRSKTQSQFEHCIIRHCNYGLVVENGSISVKHTLFEKNSISGLVAKNAEVSLLATIFTGGHLAAINIREKGVVRADSLTIKENRTGIACDSFSTLKITNGMINSNTNGIVVSEKSSVEIVAVDITKNRNGVVASQEIPRRMREMVFSNGQDLKIVNPEELKSVLKDPQMVKSIAMAKATRQQPVDNSFKPGFSALNAPQESDVSFIGNVTTGFSYFLPHTRHHPKDDSIRYQQKYIGEQSDQWFSGLQPEIQLFGNGKRGSVDVNLLIDMFGNDWLSTNHYLGKNMFNLSLSYDPHTAVIGDFFESGTETSISGRQMTGLKYTGSFFKMGGGMDRIEVKLAAGESEIPKDVGQRELNIVSDTVDTGMSIRQQITYIASATIRPEKNSSIIIKGIIAHDQADKPLLRRAIEDVAAPEPVKSQTGCIEGNLAILDGKVQLYSEINLGSHDTISGDEKKDIAWYNPQIDEAIPNVFKLLSRNKFQDYYAFTAGARSMIGGYSLDGQFLQIGQSYFSAGNPYLENDRRTISLSSEKQYAENLSASGRYEYERTGLSNVSSNDYHTLNLNGEYSIPGDNKPSFNAAYTMQFENTPSSERVEISSDSTITSKFDDRSVNNMISVEGKQVFANGIGFSLRYQFMYDNDFSDHPEISREDISDRIQNQVNGWFSFKIKKRLKSKTTFRVTHKYENRDSLRSVAYRFGENLNVTVIPRKLTCILIGDYTNKNDRQYQIDSLSGYWYDTKSHIYSADIETRYSVTAKLSFSLKGRYEISYDEAASSIENYKLYMVGFHTTWLF